MADGLAATLKETWADQLAAGFVLGDPFGPVDTRTVFDPATGIEFRFRWLPHRELRTDTAELERRGILNPNYDEADLYHDPRDASGRHCFLCPANVGVCNPMEALVPVCAGGKQWVAGTNYAWLARDHFTLMTERHEDQEYSRELLEAMLDFHEQTEGTFRVVFNGPSAGATIPWHLHLHVISDPMPVECLRRGSADEYPLPVRVFRLAETSVESVHDHVSGWESRDPDHHRVNLLVAPGTEGPVVFVFLRDARYTHASNKGLMGGWEVCGDFAYSEPGMRGEFEAASLETVQIALGEVVPEALRSLG